MKADKLHLYIVAGITSSKIKRCHLVLTQCVSPDMMERLSKLVTTRDAQRAVEIEKSNRNLLLHYDLYFYIWQVYRALPLFSCCERSNTENRIPKAENIQCN